jgi:hypothetical protein
VKRIRKKISVYLLAAVVGLGCLPFTVYAQDEAVNAASADGDENSFVSDGENADESSSENGSENGNENADESRFVNGAESGGEVQLQNADGNNAGSFHVEGGTEGTDWAYEPLTNILTFKKPGSYTVTGDGTETTEKIIVEGSFGKGSITIEDININLGRKPSTGPAADGRVDLCAFTVQSGADLTLNLQGSNTLVSGTHTAYGLPEYMSHLLACGSAGIAAQGSLTIEGEGSLTVQGGANAAGIGSNGGFQADTHQGTITINSGTVNATGGGRGAGIGGGYIARNFGDIYINGGTVNATGGGEAAAIGAGYNNEVGAKVYISGGVVTAKSPETGIGSGYNPFVYESTPGRIEITGGTVYAEGSSVPNTNNGAGIGGGRNNAGYEIEISGGNVYAKGYTGIGAGANTETATHVVTVDIKITGGTVTSVSTYRISYGIPFEATMTVTGGSLKEIKGYCPITDESGNTLALAQFGNLSGINTITVDGKEYTRDGDHQDDGDGTFYVYLSREDHLVQAGDQTFYLVWDNTTQGFLVKDIAPAPDVEIESRTHSSVTVAPPADADTYGGAEYSTDNQTWQDSNVFEGLNANTQYTVYARYKGNETYHTSEAGRVTVTTMKDGNELINEPLGLTAVYGQELSQIALPDGWTWADPSSTAELDERTYPARFDTSAFENEYSFSGTDGYNAEGQYVERQLALAVDKAGSSVMITDPMDKIYDGKAAEPNVYKTGSSKALTATWYEKDGADWKELSEAPSDAGTYKVALSLEEDEQYYGAYDEQEFTISRAENQWIKELEISGWTYGETGSVPEAAAKFGDVTYTYSDSLDGTYTKEAPTNAGVWYVKASVEGNENYTGLEAAKEFVIDKAVPKYTLPENLKMLKGEALSSLKLPEGFAWENPEQTAEQTGDFTFPAIYTPEDTENYQTVRLELSVSVVTSMITEDPKDPEKEEPGKPEKEPIKPDQDSGKEEDQNRPDGDKAVQNAADTGDPFDPVLLTVLLASSAACLILILSLLAGKRKKKL